MIILANAHFGITCKNLEKSIEFYEKILGMKEKSALYYGDLIPENPEERKKIPPERIRKLEAVSSEKCIVYMESLQGLRGYFFELFREWGACIENLLSKKNYSLSHINIVVDDVQGFCRDLLEKGAEEYIDIWPGAGICQNYTMWIHDPDGNQIEIHEYRPTCPCRWMERKSLSPSDHHRYPHDACEQFRYDSVHE